MFSLAEGILNLKSSRFKCIAACYQHLCTAIIQCSLFVDCRETCKLRASCNWVLIRHCDEQLLSALQIVHEFEFVVFEVCCVALCVECHTIIG